MTIRLSQAVAAALAAGAVSFVFAQGDSSSAPALQQPGVQPQSTQPAPQPDPQAPEAVQNPKDRAQAPQVVTEEQKGAAQADQEAAQNGESTPPSSVTYANAPKSNKIPSDIANLHFAQEPVASPMKTGGADDALVGGIVTALNNDASLKGSKVVVSSDNGVVTVTGATMTPDQKAKIDQIVVAQAGEGKVINTVLDSVT